MGPWAWWSILWSFAWKRWHRFKAFVLQQDIIFPHLGAKDHENITWALLRALPKNIIGHIKCAPILNRSSELRLKISKKWWKSNWKCCNQTGWWTLALSGFISHPPQHVKHCRITWYSHQDMIFTSTVDRLRSTVPRHAMLQAAGDMLHPFLWSSEGNVMTRNL